MAKARARERVSSEVCNAEISSTNFYIVSLNFARDDELSNKTDHNWDGVEEMQAYIVPQNKPIIWKKQLTQHDHIPTTRDAFAFPFSEAADTVGSIVDAAIFVILIEDVFEANIALGLNSLASSPKIFCFNDKFPETAFQHGYLDSFNQIQYTSLTHLNYHIYIAKSRDTLVLRNNGNT